MDMVLFTSGVQIYEDYTLISICLQFLKASLFDQISNLGQAYFFDIVLGPNVVLFTVREGFNPRFVCRSIHERGDNMKTNVSKMAGNLRILLLIKWCLRACL